MDVVINLAVHAFDQYLVSIKRMLALNYEIGGYLILHTGKMFHLVKGSKDTPYIPHMEILPFYSLKPIINWHTHYNHISDAVDGLPKNSPRLIPSNTDIKTYIETSLKYKRPCVSVVLSKWGYFFIVIPDALINYLLESKDKDKIINGIEQKIEEANGKYFIDEQDNMMEERVYNFIEAMKSVVENGNQVYGFHCRMFFRPLDNFDFFMTL